MGLITVQVSLTNPRREQSSPLAADALVDTGTMHLCLPREVADALELPMLEYRNVQTAAGISRRVPYVGPVQVHLNGHGCFAGALVMGNQVLLGAVIMEDLNVVVCPVEQKVVVNPKLPIV